jgi:uncharacterized membrane protein
MALLLVGVVLWSVTHLFPAVVPGIRANLVRKFGEGPYKGLYALDILLSLVLIVYGWRTTMPVALYEPPMHSNPFLTVALTLAILLFVASSTPNNFRRYVRHPQMAAVVTWGVAHLLTNGDSRSVILFGGLSIWAILEIGFINNRDGRWKRPDSVPLAKDLVAVFIAAGASALLVYFHAAIFGVPAISNF